LATHWRHGHGSGTINDMAGEFQVVDARLAALYVTRIFGRPCAPSTIRRWASDGRLPRAGRDGRRVTYRLEDVHRIAAGGEVQESAA
jgi:hypothetical protein